MDSDTGRFISRDTWSGNYNRPLSLNRWNYTESNPIDFVDPTGRYGEDVHYELTVVVSRVVGTNHCRGLACAVKDTIARLIAQGDQNMDDSGLLQAFLVSPELHFADALTVKRNVNAAIATGDPFLFGASLHQAQDWYSHWNEGYRPPLGHGQDSYLAGYLTGGRSEKMIQDFYGRWPKDVVLAAMRTSYSDAELALVSDDKMIDLFIYTLNMVSLRSTYGYDPDHYFGFTPRDAQMKEDMVSKISAFFEAFDDCDFCQLMLRT